MMKPAPALPDVELVMQAPDKGRLDTGEDVAVERRPLTDSEWAAASRRYAYLGSIGSMSTHDRDGYYSVPCQRQHRAYLTGGVLVLDTVPAEEADTVKRGGRPDMAYLRVEGGRLIGLIY